MKFLIDENITPDLVSIFRDEGLTAFHINELKSHSKQRVLDDQLRRLAIQKGYIIVTKDDDFVSSFVSRKVPEKMVFLYGLNSKDVLLSRVGYVIGKLSSWLKIHDFIEIRTDNIRFPFSQ